METYVNEVYARFDAKRKAYEAELVDKDDLKILEDQIWQENINQ